MGKGFRPHGRAAAKISGKGQRGGKPKSGKVETTRVDPRIMRAALKAAGGDASRLKISKDGKSVEVTDSRYDRGRLPGLGS